MTYEHPHKDPNLSGPNRAMKYDADGEPVLRVSVENVESNSGTAIGSNKPFYLEVSQGLIDGYDSNHKFGAVPSMSQNTTGSIWDVNDTLYPWDALGAGSVVNVERNNVADDGETITVQGLDANYDFVEEDIIMSGADTVGSTTFIRVNRAFVKTNGGTNVGDIDIEVGAAGGTTIARITAGQGQTLMAVYTIPAGKTAYLLGMNSSAENDTDATITMLSKAVGGVFRVVSTFELQQRGGGFNHEFIVPLAIPEKTDIDTRAITRASNKRITSTFDVLLVDNA